MSRKYKVPVSFTYTGDVYLHAESSKEAKAIVESSFNHHGNPSFVGGSDILTWSIQIPADKKIFRPYLLRKK